MVRSTVGLYWKVVACCSILGTGLTVAFLMVMYLLFGNEFGWEHVLDSFARGIALGLLTALMVVLATLVTARHLDTRWGKGLFVLLSFFGASLGWLLVGVLNGVLSSSSWLFDLPWLPAVLSAGATLIAAIATFFMPASGSQTSAADGDFAELLGDDGRD